MFTDFLGTGSNKTDKTDVYKLISFKHIDTNYICVNARHICILLILKQQFFIANKQMSK